MLKKSKIKNSRAFYDEVALSGSRTPWKQVLAIYAFKIITGFIHMQNLIETATLGILAPHHA